MDIDRKVDKIERRNSGKKVDRQTDLGRGTNIQL